MVIPCSARCYRRREERASVKARWMQSTASLSRKSPQKMPTKPCKRCDDDRLWGKCRWTVNKNKTRLEWCELPSVSGLAAPVSVWTPLGFTWGQTWLGPHGVISLFICRAAHSQASCSAVHHCPSCVLTLFFVVVRGWLFSFLQVSKT